MKLNKEIQAYYYPIGGIYSRPDDYLKIRYDLISTLVYHVIFINIDGSLKKQPWYDPEEIISYAHSKGVKIVLSFASPTTDAEADIFLADSNARTVAINNLLNEVKLYNFDGVDNDFEKCNGINSVTGTPNKAFITTFQSELSDKFRSYNPNYRISMSAISIYDYNDLIDLATLDSKVDYFMIQTYGFRWENSTKAGSFTPVNGRNNDNTVDWSIRWSLNWWYNKGINKNKLLLGISYEDIEWPTVSDTVLSVTTGLGRRFPYNNEIDKILTYTNKFDDTWKTPWATYQYNGQWYQVHYDDVQSLGIKYDIVYSDNLAGIGIWDINYGIGRDELWRLIEDRFLSTIDQLKIIMINPVLTNVNIGAIKRLTAVCKSQSNNTIICPTLTWTSSNTSIVIVSQTGVVKGISRGTTNVVASASGIISNKSTVTVRNYKKKQDIYII